MRNIGVVTVARSDYGIYRPVLQQIEALPDLKLSLFVSGMHLSPEFGLTIQEIEKDGFDIVERIEMLLSSDMPEGVAKSTGLGIIGFAQAYTRFKPDILLVLGDRFEMLASVIAALPFNIPIAHLHGGEATEGLIDEPIRHSITKMSHLHFVATETYAQRVIQMGEEPWRVTVSGAPSLDNLKTISLLERSDLEKSLNIPLQKPPLLVTYHPVTFEYEDTSTHITNLLSALETLNLPVIFTYPNADTHGRIIIQAIDEFVQHHDQAWAVVNLGTQRYFSLMKYAKAMVGNSSSGIIEAASFALPVINIGNRQRGRFHSFNVLDVDYDKGAIITAIQKATTNDFQATLQRMKNPYGDGQAAECIVQILRNVPLGRNLILKPFYNLPASIEEV